MPYFTALRQLLKHIPVVNPCSGSVSVADCNTAAADISALQVLHISAWVQVCLQLAVWGTDKNTDINTYLQLVI